MNRMKLALARLTQRLRGRSSDLVTYARGYDSVEVPAIFGEKLLKVDDGRGGFRIEWTDLDFLIASSDLVLDGVRILPRRGDLIHVVYESDVQTFEVRPWGNDPAWKWADPYHSIYRIHAKHIDTQQFYQ